MIVQINDKKQSALRKGSTPRKRLNAPAEVKGSTNFEHHLSNKTITLGSFLVCLHDYVSITRGKVCFAGNGRKIIILQRF